MNHYFVDRRDHGDENANLKQENRSSFISGIKALFGDVEMAPYTATEREGYEERVYPPGKWAVTSLSGEERDAVSSAMYRRLLNYMSGKNKQNVRLPMTTPLSTLVECVNKGSTDYTMALFIPEQSQLTPPTPGVDVVLEQRLQTTVYTRKFGGYATDATVAREVKELSVILKNSQEVKDQIDFTKYYIVTYDQSFKLIGRRNEIWFVKKNIKC